ncbi:hypothetical protein [Pseudomonas sp. SST3]|uniref:hypothetical protein n=1 Tax=Pseudomonas sp. SST3 TaxID=2267882 RepID=UPI000E04D936|nr:hypothetical protein [Pseudomonas sp. SST3]NKQ10841.1 hypothetical protein [Pseudomonas sp. SST3]
MRNRWALCAVVALTAFIAAGDLLLTVELSGEAATQNTAVRASAFTNWLLEHQRLINTAKLIVSTLMLLWWLAATIRPTRRPRLRLANVAFSGWLAIETVTVWAAVLGVLYQVSGLSDGLTGGGTLTIIKGTELSWLIPLTFCIPALQLILGEWAYRSGQSSAQRQMSSTISQAEAA